MTEMPARSWPWHRPTRWPRDVEAGPRTSAIMSPVSDPVLSATAVELTIPADVRYLASARMVSTAFAADLGFSVDDLDELRIAVNEMLTVYLDAVADGSRVRLCFEAEGGDASSLRVTGGLVDPANAPGAVEVDDLARRILTALTDSFSIGPVGFELHKSV
jgi:hypothetical protein